MQAARTEDYVSGPGRHSDQGRSAGPGIWSQNHNGSLLCKRPGPKIISSVQAGAATRAERPCASGRIDLHLVRSCASGRIDLHLVRPCASGRIDLHLVRSCPFVLAPPPPTVADSLGGWFVVADAVRGEKHVLVPPGASEFLPGGGNYSGCFD